MNILAVDTTGKHLTVGVKHGGVWLVTFNKNCNLNHSVSLNAEIDRLMKQAGLSFADLDVYACNVGVGSFTGIRVGIAAMKGFGLACPKKFVEVNTFEVLAYNEAKPLTVLVPDNRGFYRADFAADGSCSEPRHFEEAGDVGSRIVYDEETDYTAKFTALIDEKVLNGQFVETLTPLYIRKSQAEEGR